MGRTSISSRNTNISTLHSNDDDDDDHNNDDDDDICDMIGRTQTGKESDPQCATIG